MTTFLIAIAIYLIISFLTLIMIMWQEDWNLDIEMVFFSLIPIVNAILVIAILFFMAGRMLSNKIKNE